jgi:triosephosphate isomerase
MGGNWKLNPTSIESAKKLAGDLVSMNQNSKDVDVVIFPPFTLLPLINPMVQGSKIKVYILSNFPKFI